MPERSVSTEDSVSTENDTSTEHHETIIGNTTFRVISKYIGTTPFLCHIKNAIERDVQTAIYEGQAAEETCCNPISEV